LPCQINNPVAAAPQFQNNLEAADNRFRGNTTSGIEAAAYGTKLPADFTGNRFRVSAAFFAELL